MAAKSNADLTAEIIAVITGQTTPESITPTTHGALEKDIVDSFWNKVDDDLNRTRFFANSAFRSAAVPDFLGQYGTQIDTNTVYISTGVSAGDWALPANTQIQSDTYGVASGIDTYSVTLTPALAAYAAGNSFKILFTNANTGAASLSVNGLAAKAIKKNGNVALIGGDIQAGTIYTLTYDGTNFQIDNSGFAASSTYRKYVALITQTGISAPIATVLENTLGGTVVWGYSAIGIYTATLAGAFTASKTHIMFPPISNQNGGGAGDVRYMLISRSNVNTIVAQVNDGVSGYVDGILLDVAVEIRVYP